MLYKARSGEVMLKCSSQDQGLYFEVLDEGELSEGELDHLAADQGTGLGLRICHDLLALLGSRLQARTRPQGGKGGSCFWFKLVAPI